MAIARPKAPPRRAQRQAARQPVPQDIETRFLREQEQVERRATTPEPAAPTAAAPPPTRSRIKPEWKPDFTSNTPFAGMPADWTGIKPTDPSQFIDTSIAIRPDILLDRLRKAGAPLATQLKFIRQHPEVRGSIVPSVQSVFKELTAFNRLTGKPKFDEAKRLGLVPHDAPFIIGIKFEDRRFLSTKAKEKLRQDSPALFTILQTKGFAALQAAIKSKRTEAAGVQAAAKIRAKREQRGRLATEQERAKFLAANIKLSTGEFITKQDFAALTPGQQVVVRKIGVDAFNKRLDQINRRLGKFRSSAGGVVGVDLVQALWGSLSKGEKQKLAEGQTTVNFALKGDPIVEDIGLAFGKDALKKAKLDLALQASRGQVGPPRDVRRPKAKLEIGPAPVAELRPLSARDDARRLRGEMKPIKVQKPSAATIAAQIGLSLIPGVVPFQKVKEYRKDGFTTKEIAEIVGWSALDLLTIIPILGGVAAGARAARGLGAAARARAVAGAAKQVAIAEVKAPYTVIRHPLRTLKTLADPIETIFRPSRVPLVATEIRTSTVRIPVKSFGNVDEALRLRDAATLRAIKGENVTAQLGTTKLSLTRTSLQKVAGPVAVHTSPDIRPFLEGATIKTGREGGLFVSPNVHTRFAAASAFGDMPTDGIKGALLIRDPKVLQGLATSGKTFKQTVEIEAKLKPGLKLGKASQLLFTRDAAGDKVVLAVFGEPFKAAEIARLKLVGTADIVKQLFIDPAKVGKVAKANIVSYDEVLDLRKRGQKLLTKAKRARAAGKAEEAARLTTEAAGLERRAARIAERISGVQGRLALAASNTQPTGPLERLDRQAGAKRTGAAVRRVPAVVLSSRVLAATSRVTVSRPDAPAVIRLAGLPTRGRTVREARRATVEAARAARAARIPLAPRAARATAPARPAKALRPTTAPTPARPVTKEPTRAVPPATGIVKGGEPVPPRPSGVKRKKKRLTKKQREGAVAWRQGIVFVVVIPPFATRDDVRFFRKLPAGVKLAPNARTAAETIQTITGKPPSKDIKVRLGFATATIRQPSREPGKAGAITFTTERRRSAPAEPAAPRSTLVSRRRGRIFVTATPRGGRMLSRRPVPGARVSRR